MIIREFGPVLQGSVIVAQVLVQSVLRCIYLLYLIASGTLEGDLHGSRDRRNWFTGMCQVHRILSKDDAFVLTF